VDYQFLLGKAFRLQNQVYVASALGKSEGAEVVRAVTRVNGEAVMRTFLAAKVLRHLVVDEEIEIADVAFTR